MKYQDILANLKTLKPGDKIVSQIFEKTTTIEFVRDRPREECNEDGMKFYGKDENGVEHPYCRWDFTDARTLEIIRA